jgi:hypothetical protein
MIVKYGFLTAIGIIVSLVALYWIAPETAGGQGLLVVIVLAIVNGIGGVSWPRKATKGTGATKPSRKKLQKS